MRSRRSAGVPTVLVDGEPFWGDDRLEAAATRIAA
jgi:2-hydroxychromene-2-carboxylate isomerase